MSAPTVATEPLMLVEVVLRHTPIGATPWGERSEVFFDGTATSPHWDGEWAVTGVDHIVRGSHGTARIDVHVIISGPAGEEVVTYRGHGRGGPTGVLEGVTFETSSERLAWLNDAVAVGAATLHGDRLSVALFQLHR